MSTMKPIHEADDVPRDLTLRLLDSILDDFGISRADGRSEIRLVGTIPDTQHTNSQHINMTLVGAVPSLANAVVACQIFEARGGEAQSITVDLRRSHNYLDPDIGMTPTINSQVGIMGPCMPFGELTREQEITLDMVAGNPFLGGIYETADRHHVVPSAVYVELVYRWSTLLQCPVNDVDVAAAIRKWSAEGSCP